MICTVLISLCIDWFCFINVVVISEYVICSTLFCLVLFLYLSSLLYGVGTMFEDVYVYGLQDFVILNIPCFVLSMLL